MLSAKRSHKKNVQRWVGSNEEKASKLLKKSGLNDCGTSLVANAQVT
jgi:hypothetical protein